ncbi:MAG: B12-binding domain-containing radical SAM protein [Candidatus Bathyarchaeia archaeon]
MKFSFVNPPLNTELSTREKKKMIGASPPMGILYVATYLKQSGIEVSVLDATALNLTMDETARWVKKEDPDIVGFSTLTSTSRTAPQIAKQAKEENPNLTIVFGGLHATYNPKKILKKYPWIDIIVRGEGEHTALELARALEKETSLKTVQGITFRNNGNIASTPDRPLIKDVDTIPFPDRTLLTTEYHALAAGINAAPKKYTSFVTSRGCVYNCRFCGIRALAKNIWRPRSVRNALEELLFLESEGYRQFHFVDDNFMINQKRAIKLCKEIRRERLDIDWIALGRVDNCSQQLLKELVRAGCKIIHFGIESANQRILNYYNKRITPQQSKTAVKTARKAGVDVIIGSLIVGAPDETRQEIQNTLEFAKQLRLDIPEINLLGAFSGMEIWDELASKGVLDEELYWETGVSVPEICPNAVPPEEINKMINEHLRHFLLRPSFMIDEILKTLKSTYRLNLFINNLTRIETILETVRFFT